MTGNGATKKQGTEGSSDERKATITLKSEETGRDQKEPIVSPSLSSLVTPATLAVFKSDNSEWEKDTITIPDGKEKGDRGPRMNWATLQKLDSEAQRSTDESSNAMSGHPSPTSKLAHQDMKTFGAMPSEEEPVILECTTCSKPIVANNFTDHVEPCGKSKGDLEPSAGLSNVKVDDSDSIVVVAKTSNSTPNTKKDKSNSKKRKNSVASVTSDTSEAPGHGPSKRPPSQIADKPPPDKKQKVKKEKPKPTPKVKAPLDLDKQCGVIGPTGLPCTRSLTCKSHSMGSKRAVLGRSQPYDILLTTYQKKSIGRPNNNSQLSADQKPVGGSSLGGAASQNVDDTNLDSDEEVNTVLDAIKSSNPRPLATRQILFVRRRNHCFKIRDILLEAITPKERSISPTRERADGPSSSILANGQEWTERRLNGLI